MPAAELPQGEEDRLSALRALEILDTPAEERFDLFTRLAAEIAGTPIAAISLIDEDRQWFKSSIGLPLPETPREQSFCAHAILAPQQTLVVPDAAADARFADNPLVTGSLGIRFYAGVPLLHPDGHPLGALCVIDRSPRELTPRQRAQLEDLAQGVSATLELYRALRALGELAATDPLTGCANRGALAAALKRLQGQADLPFALFCLDLDRFKAINDLLGHAAGDAALTEVARRLRAVTRYIDVVARPGGDEFVIAAPGLRRAEEADLVADRILAAMAEPFAFEGQPVPLRTSIGIALVPQDSADPEEALRRADAALYQAKRASGRRVAHAATLLAGARPDGSGTARPGRTALLDSLRTALADPAAVPFTLDWQPIFQAARPDQVRSAEALIRWPRRAGAQALLPGDFLPVAERHGLMPTLDRWVLGRACREAASWPATTPIAVNLAAASFLTLDLVDTVERALGESGLPASRLYLEVTESALIGDIARARTMLEALQRLGIKIALDDFGTGHASLAYLRDLPFDTIKIDRSFVIPIETDRRSQKLVRAILQFARSLGLLTVAEGVETISQFEFLQAEGVDAVQGYLFARPGPAAAFLPATPALLPVAI